MSIDYCALNICTCIIYVLLKKITAKSYILAEILNFLTVYICIYLCMLIYLYKKLIYVHA